MRTTGSQKLGRLKQAERAAAHVQRRARRAHTTGPVLSSRLYEGLRLEEPKVTLASVPTPALRPAGAMPRSNPIWNAFPLPNGRDPRVRRGRVRRKLFGSSSFDILSLRLDYRMTPGLTAFMRINHAPSDSMRGATLSTVNRTTLENDSITAGTTWAGRPRVTGDLRVNWTRNRGGFFQDSTRWAAQLCLGPPTFFWRAGIRRAPGLVLARRVPAGHGTGHRRCATADQRRGQPGLGSPARITSSSVSMFDG